MIDLDELERLAKAGDRYGHISPDVVLSLIVELREARKTLHDIAEQEHIELMLDPTWAQRVAKAALAPRDPT